MLEDYTFKYIDKLFSRGIDREELHIDTSLLCSHR